MSITAKQAIIIARRLNGLSVAFNRIASGAPGTGTPEHLEQLRAMLAELQKDLDIVLDHKEH